jgi:hypothetical protein
MWVVTRSDWPVLVNLDRAATIGYQQVAKFDARTRVIAAAWEQEHVLAECADGDQARGLVGVIARAIADDQSLLDLQDVDLVRIGREFATNREGHQS